VAAELFKYYIINSIIGDLKVKVENVINLLFLGYIGLFPPENDGGKHG
jgi:hypothetical protein